MEAQPSTVFALALGVGIACQLLARHLRMPAIVLLLGAGVALGPDGLAWIRPADLGAGLLPIVSLAVAVILFEGGLGLDLRRLRRAATPIRRLVTLGAFVTTVGGGAAAHYLMGWPIGEAMLFGTLVIVTGPTVIRPLLRITRLRPTLATVLEAEGLLIDPVGAMVAAVAVQFVAAPGLDAAASGAAGLVARLLFGTVAGGAAGLALVGLLRLPRAVPEGYENLVVLGGALVTFVLCERVLHESGILAVTVAGMVVGNLEEHVARELGEFQEQLTRALIGILFILLAADVRLAHVASLGTAAWLTVAALALFVRPAGVALSTWGSSLTLRERVFLSWVAPRGVVAAAVASIAAAVLIDLGRGSEAQEIRALVFLTIAVTVILQGGSAPIVARLLGVQAPGRETVVILGAEGLGFALAEVLERSARKVLFVDTNPGHCRQAEERGFAVVYGNAFEPSTRARLRLEQAGAAVATTGNAQLNIHFAEEAREGERVPDVYAAIDRQSQEIGERIVEKRAIHILYDRPKDVERWNVRFRHGQAETIDLRFVGTTPDTDAEDRPTLAGTVDHFVMVAMLRGEMWEPMAAERTPAEGDRIVAVLHTPTRDAALDALRGLGFEPLPPEEDAASEPAVENGG
jgi:NhaP-type Na+/H+ or K+/H+ antiporter